VRVGVLALQGDFDAHRRRLAELGAEATLVRSAPELAEVDALVIPGGESTTLLKLMDDVEALRDFAAQKPTFGTCAGAIVLAAVGALDVRVRRNAYGRQLDSSIRQGTFQGTPMEMVFIRAPKIVSVGPKVEVLATEGNDIVAVRQGHVLAATFHPELTDDTRLHEMFLGAPASRRLARRRLGAAGGGTPPGQPPGRRRA